MNKSNSNIKECCEKCSSYFEHRRGSHSDDYGGESDYPCYCNKDDCGKKDCPCHSSQEKSYSGEIAIDVDKDKLLECYICNPKGRYKFEPGAVLPVCDVNKHFPNELCKCDTPTPVASQERCKHDVVVPDCFECYPTPVATEEEVRCSKCNEILWSTTYTERNHICATEEKEYTEKFSNRFTEIARLADKGDDKGYGKGLARLEIDIMDFISSRKHLWEKKAREEGLLAGLRNCQDACKLAEIDGERTTLERCVGMVEEKLKWYSGVGNGPIRDALDDLKAKLLEELNK